MKREKKAGKERIKCSKVNSVKRIKKRKVERK